MHKSKLEVKIKVSSVVKKKKKKKKMMAENLPGASSPLKVYVRRDNESRVHWTAQNLIECYCLQKAAIRNMYSGEQQVSHSS